MKQTEANQSLIDPKRDPNGIIKYINPSAPEKDQEFRKRDLVVSLTTNLLKLEISKQEQKLCIYSVTVQPELAKDNYSLLSKIQRQIDNELNKYFTRKCFSGNKIIIIFPA